jgi:hypothetical protein
MQYIVLLNIIILKIIIFIIKYFYTTGLFGIGTGIDGDNTEVFNTEVLDIGFGIVGDNCCFKDKYFILYFKYFFL